MLELLYSASSCTNVPRFGPAAHYELRGWEPCGQPRVQGTDLSPGAAVMRPGPATSPSGWPGESLPRYSVTSAEEAASVCVCGGGPGEGLWMSVWRLRSGTRSPKTALVPLSL